MCGLTGFLSPQGFAKAEALAILTRMRDTLVHRGPDDAGVWLDSDAGIALAHRRLSIMDLSPAGHQPMASISGRYVVIFNGEIYSHKMIRLQLEDAGFPQTEWRGHSDTETLLAAIERWGLQSAIQRCVGMFAFALWDRRERTLSLARDRMGEKPLYYGWQSGTLLFGSELKALRAHPAFGNEIDRDALPLYLRHGYIPAPWSIWQGIRKLMPGTVARFSPAQRGELPEPVSYWSLQGTIAEGNVEPFTGSDEDGIDALELQLTQSIADQMVADVPLGAFLSGGIDSTTVVALMQAQSSQPVKTFTIGFHEKGYDEAKHAKAVANHLRTDHTELYLSAAQGMEVIPRLPELYDEPFGDSSAIPTHLVSRLARENVTVSLSGDGGDELFGGYGRYFDHKALSVWQACRKIPSALRKPMTSVLRGQFVSKSDQLLYWMSTCLGRPYNKSVAGRCALIAGLIECQSRPAFYRTMTSQWILPPVIREQGVTLPYGLDEADLLAIQESVQQMMASDCVTYLPDDILVKVDRAAMAVSLETRVPLLDHRVVELAWRIPYNMKVRAGEGKWLLRQVLYRHVPRSLVERPKMGFGVPIDEWLRGPLRDWAESLLDEARLKKEGFLDHRPIRRRWKDHLQLRHNWRDSLWVVLMWQAWLEENIA